MEEYIEKTEVKLFLLNHKISEIIFISASPFFSHARDEYQKILS